MIVHELSVLNTPMTQETWVQSQVESYQRLKKMVLDAALFNIR